MASNPLSIVIIGSNIAGNMITHHVLKHVTPNSPRPVKVTVVSPSTNFYWTIGVPRAILGKESFDSSAIVVDLIEPLKANYGEQGGKWDFVEGWARGVDFRSKTVTVEKVAQSKEQVQIRYDHLIIATDQLEIRTPFKPLGTTQEMVESLKAWGRKIEQANTIVISGAGPTGVETAGEIKYAYPNKRVILVGASDEPLPMLKPHISAVARNMIKKIGIELRTGTKVTGVIPTPSNIGVEVILHTGESIPADLYIPTGGQLPNTEFLPKEVLDEHGHVTVTKYLNLPAYPDVWAVGDVTHYTGNRKAAPTIGEMSHALTLNLKKAVLDGNKAVVGGEGWVEYVHDLSMIIIVPVGPKQGTGELKGWRLWSWLVWLFKGRNMGISMIKGYVTGSNTPKKLKA